LKGKKEQYLLLSFDEDGGGSGIGKRGMDVKQQHIHFGSGTQRKKRRKEEF